MGDDDASGPDPGEVVGIQKVIVDPSVDGPVIVYSEPLPREVQTIPAGEFDRTEPSWGPFM